VDSAEAPALREHLKEFKATLPESVSGGSDGL